MEENKESGNSIKEEQEHRLNKYGQSDDDEEKQRNKQKLSVESIVKEEEKDDAEIKEESDMLQYNEQLEKSDMLQYNEQLEKSDGFDVEDFPRLKKVYYGLQVPLSNPHDVNTVRECAEFALKEYNKYNPIKYHLVKVLKANAAACGIATFYITFLVEDDNGDSKTFQAVVYDGMNDDDGNPVREVLRFRFKPDQQSEVAAASGGECG